MEQEQIERIASKSKDKAYHVFLYNRGWKYENERDALIGYYRMKSSKEGRPLTLTGFLLELPPGVNEEKAKKLYQVLRGLIDKGALSAYDLYQYAEFRWCLNHPEAVTAYRIGSQRWAVNNCDTEVSEDWAKLKVNSEFGFEVSRIEILDTPYYESTDWNYIRFRCGPYDWLFKDGELNQIYQ